MCGIFGLVGDIPFDLQLAANVLRRRGPDDHGFWDSGEGVKLGHVRLSIIDVSSLGHQPMISSDRRVVMVFNGEIFNYRELRNDPGVSGYPFVGSSDSEVLLALFRTYGSACFKMLNGIFAAAFWECDTKRLTLVRDPMGVKPLYIVRDGFRSIAFASEMKALLRGVRRSWQLNPKAVLSHLCYLWSPGTDTIVNGIEKLLPGHYVEFSENAPARYVNYRDIVREVDRPTQSAQEWVQQLQAELRHAVGRQMVSDVPLGAFLSGGLDSSSIVAFAQEHLKSHDNPERLKCFTVGFSGKGTGTEGFVEDLPYAQKVASHLNVELHIVRADPTMMERLPEALYLLDEPTPDPAALSTLLISELARSMGIKVLLSGTGGDDIFTGYRRHYALAQEKYWRDLPLAMRSALSAASSLLPQNTSIGRRVAKAFRYSRLDADRRLVSYFMWLDPARAIGLLTPEYARGFRDDSAFDPMLATLARVPHDQEPLERMLYLECKHFLADHNLNYADKMGMAAGVEVRVPLLDLRLVDFVSTIPVGLKQRGNVGKWIFKKSMQGILPDEVIFRRKTGFGVPLRSWLNGFMKPLVDDTLSYQSLLKRGVFCPGQVDMLRLEDRAGRVDASYPIFSMVCIELWCRQYLDGNFAVA